MKNLLRLLSFLRPALGQVALSILAGVATIGAGVGLLGTSAYLIASAALHPSIAELQVAIVGVRFFGISRGVFRYLERLVSHSVNLKVLSEIRVWFYRTIEPLAPARLQATRSGDLLQRATGDIETLENFYVRCVSPVIVAFITGVLACVFLGTIFPPLSWIFAAGLVINGIVLPAVALLFSRRNSRELVNSRADASAGMVEFVQSLGDLQVFGAEKRVLEKVNQTADKYTNRVLRNTLQSSLTDGLGLLVVHLTVLIALWVMIPGVSQGELSGVVLAVVALFIQAGFEGVTPLPLAAQQLGASLEAAGRLFDLAAPAQPLTVPEMKSQPLTPPMVLKVDHLSFDYGSGEDWALRDLSFTLEQGKKLALIGPSGAGKSSLLNLILHFWVPNQGSICLDQTNINHLDEDWLRRQFGVISQDTTLFSISLRDNLLLAKPDASDAELISALHDVELDDWLSSLPEGLGSWLGEQGVHLSAGERQRVAIARILLQKPPFLLLDEPVANLDPTTGALIMRQLFNLVQHSGILYITHDLLHIEEMDEILLLENGNLIDRGTATELLGKAGRFAQLVKIQANWMEMPD